MAIAKGMTEREWLIYEKSRCLQYLLSSVMKTAEEMRTRVVETIELMAEKESEGDLNIQKEREAYYLNLFNTAIPDDVEQTFLQSMIVQICTYLEAVLKDIALDKNQDKGVSKIESFYYHIQVEKGKNLGPITDHISDWTRLHRMRNDITHDGSTTEKVTQQYIERMIEESRIFLTEVEKI